MNLSSWYILFLLLNDLGKAQRPPVPPLILISNERSQDDRLAATSSSTTTTSLAKCVCPLLLRPVCALDGQTHSNRCVANCKRANILCEGRCPCPVKENEEEEENPNQPGAEESALSTSLNKACVCQLIYLPVCAMDNRTSFNNECEARCRNKEVRCQGTCPCPNDDNNDNNNNNGNKNGNRVSRVCRCLPTEHPVCGVDNETYTNECYAACKLVPIQCRRACPCSFF